MLDIRALNHEDYDKILVDWWKSWGWEPPTRDFLPMDGSGGMIVYDGDVPVVAGFIYATNSKVFWVDWIISSKDYRGDLRPYAIKLLIECLTKVAKDSGAKITYALIKHEGLISTYENLGYIRGDRYNTEMIKVF
jgi:hypothetical protein